MKYFLRVKHLFVWLACHLVLSCTLFAQSANQDFRKVNANYEQHSNLRMEIVYTLFPSYTSTTVKDKQTGVYMKQGQKQYSNLLGIESLYNERLTVVADHNDKVLVLADPFKQKREAVPFNIDSLLLQFSSVKYSEINGRKVYTLTFENRQFFEYKKIEIHINSSSWFIDKMIFYFKEQVNLDEENEEALKDSPRLEIVYKNITTEPTFEPNQFSEKRFISLAGTGYQTTAAYNGFTLLNQKIKKK